MIHEKQLKPFTVIKVNIQQQKNQQIGAEQNTSVGVLKTTESGYTEVHQKTSDLVPSSSTLVNKSSSSFSESTNTDEDGNVEADSTNSSGLDRDVGGGLYNDDDGSGGEDAPFFIATIGSISGFDIYPFISLSISSPNIACTSTKFSNMANKTFSNQMILGGKSSSSSSSTSASPKNVL